MVWPSGSPRKRQRLDLRLMADKATSHPDRDAKIKQSITAICSGTFPDNEHNTWEVRKTLHIGATTYLLVEPHPKDAGYDSFVFLLRFKPGLSFPENPAVYCLSVNSEYDLLCTSQNCPDDIPRSLIW